MFYYDRNATVKSNCRKNAFQYHLVVLDQMTMLHMISELQESYSSHFKAFGVRVANGPQRCACLLHVFLKYDEFISCMQTQMDE